LFAAAERVCVYRGGEEGLRWLLLGASCLPGWNRQGLLARRESGRMRQRDVRLLFLTGMAASADAPVPAVSDQWILRGDPLAALFTLQGEADDGPEDGPGNEQPAPIGEHRGGDEAGQSGEDDAKMYFLSGARCHGLDAGKAETFINTAALAAKRWGALGMEAGLFREVPLLDDLVHRVHVLHPVLRGEGGEFCEGFFDGGIAAEVGDGEGAGGPVTGDAEFFVSFGAFFIFVAAAAEIGIGLGGGLAGFVMADALDGGFVMGAVDEPLVSGVGAAAEADPVFADGAHAEEDAAGVFGEAALMRRLQMGEGLRGCVFRRAAGDEHEAEADECGKQRLGVKGDATCVCARGGPVMAVPRGCGGVRHGVRGDSAVLAGADECRHSFARVWGRKQM
jgi:hypothetical protein